MRGPRGFATMVLVTTLSVATTGAAQDTLADVRQDLSILYVETQKLKRELSTTGTSGVALDGASTLDRVNSIEGEMRRLTGKIEALDLRINAIVKDATNRIGDLEFRLVELEGGDISKLSHTTTLGGEPEAAQPAIAAAPLFDGTDATGHGAELATSEQADFDAAVAAFESGDTQLAAETFTLFTENYPGSPLETRARLLKGQALEQGGDNREAARAYLEAYSGDPVGRDAPDSLFLLGRSLGKLGKISEACVTLGEVAIRHPGSAAVQDTDLERTRLNCQ